MFTRELLVNNAPRLLLQALYRRNLSPSSQRPHRERKHYRLWSLPGEMIYSKDILARQFTMYWHPGLNAGIDSERTIYALCDGIMVITEEKYNPDWDYPLVKEAYTVGEEKLAPPYKRYIHVIPKRRISEFKLIDKI